MRARGALCLRDRVWADETAERYERRQAERKYVVKLCPEHEKQFNRQQTEL